MPIGSATSKLTVVLTALDRTGAGFKDAEKGLAGIGNKASAIGSKLTRSITLPLLGLGVAAGKMAMDFSDALAFSNTMMNATEEEMKRMKEVSLDLAAKTGKSSSDIARGFYDVASAGFKGAEAFKIQEVAALGAMGGFIEHSQAVNALVKNLSIYGKTGDDAMEMMDVMHGIVDKGLLTFDQLSTSFAKASSFAVPLGIDVKEMGAAMGYLTTKMASTEESAAALAALTRAFIKPTTKMRDLTKEWAKEQGLATDTTTAEMVQILGLRGTMRLLGEETGGNIEKMGELIAESTALTAVTHLTAEEGVRKLDEGFQHLNDSMGLTVKKSEIASRSMKVRLSQALEMLKGLAIEVGGALLVTLVPHIETTALKIKDLTDWFVGLGEEGQAAILKLLGILLVVGPVTAVIGSIIKLINWIKALATTTLALQAQMILLSTINPYAAFIVFSAAAILAIKEVLDTYKLLQNEVDGARESYDKAISGMTEVVNRYYKMAETGIITFEEAGRKANMLYEHMDSIGGVIDDLEKKNLWDYITGQSEPLIYKLFPKKEEKTGIQTNPYVSPKEEYAEGGIVPGPAGKPVSAIVHGGEQITPVGKSSGNNFNFNFAGAIISNKEEFSRQIMDVVNRQTKFSYLNYV